MGLSSGGGNTFNPTLDDKQVAPGTDLGGFTTADIRHPTRFLNNRLKGAMGPVDPLTGRVETPAYEVDSLASKTVEDKLLTLTDMFQQVLEQLKAEHPMVLLRVINTNGSDISPFKINATEAREFEFSLSRKRVIAQKLFIQNNSAVTIYFDFQGGVSAGKGALLAGQMLNMDAAIGRIYLMTASGSLNVNGDTAANIFIAAWGSQDEMYERGSV